jgi:SAM-dependent methyltransferase
MDPGKTGLPGEPTEPLVVSFGAVGPHDASGPDLRPAAQALRARMDTLRASHREAGWLDWDSWVLSRTFPDGRASSWAYRDGAVDERRWEQSVEGIPDWYTTVSLDADPWGTMQLAAPSPSSQRTPIRSLSAWLVSPADGVDEAAGALLRQLAVTAGQRGVSTGYVHVDTVADPYTAVVTDENRLTADRFGVEIHGYYWAVLLTDGHLAKLGGVSRVMREAPCSRIRELDLGDRQGMLCVLSDSPLDMDTKQVLDWRAFLLPVLRSGYPSGLELVGRRRSPLHRPVWLFEGNPVPRLTASILTAGASPQSASLDIEWWDRAYEPARPACWLYPGPAFKPRLHTGPVQAVVQAWAVTGRNARLDGVEGVLGGVSDVSWEEDEDGGQGLTWWVDIGTCEHKAAIRRLAAALTELGGSLGRHVFSHLRVADSGGLPTDRSAAAVAPAPAALGGQDPTHPPQWLLDPMAPEGPPAAPPGGREPSEPAAFVLDGKWGPAWPGSEPPFARTQAGESTGAEPAVDDSPPPGVDDEDLWERHAGWWQDGFTDGVDAEYTEQILPMAAGYLAGAHTVLDIGCGEGQLARLARNLGAERVVGIDPTWAQVSVAAQRGGGVDYIRSGAAALPFADASFDVAVACLVFEHIREVDAAIAEVARVLRPGGRFAFFLNHPLLQTPNSGWIDDQILDPPEQYWRIGPYLIEDESIEEVEKNVFIPFIHRPLSRYVNALATNGLVLTRMEEPAPPQGFLARAQEYEDAATIPRLLVLLTEKPA